MQFQKLAAAMAAILSVGNAQNPITTSSTVVVIDVLPAISTSTAFLTSLVTVLGCPDWETNCPVRHSQSLAVVTATTGISTTVCPLTMTQARLSSFATTVHSSALTGGPLSTTTTTWPTTYSLPTTFPLPQIYDIPSSVWSSIFPSGVPGAPSFVTSGGSSTGSTPSTAVTGSGSSGAYGASGASGYDSSVSSPSTSTRAASTSSASAALSAGSSPSSASSPASTGSTSPSSASSPVSTRSISPSVTSSPVSTPSISLSGAPSVSTPSVSPSGLSSPVSASSMSPSMSSVISWYSMMSWSTTVSIHTNVTTIGPNPTQSVSITSSSFAAIIGQNVTTYITNYGGVTVNLTQTLLPNATAGSPTLTTMTNATYRTGSPVPMQTVNVGQSTPLNLFSLLIAIVAVAVTL